MKVVITDAAFADLLEIGRFIGKDNPRRAETFVSELYDRCERLGDNPRAYPLLPRWEDRGVRRKSHGNYLIFYRIGAAAVEILHVLHGARDYEAILFPDER
jgi:toxin ParE1/3/4